MRGIVDSSGRALLKVGIRPDLTSSSTELEVWIDPGFTGELVLPQSTIDNLQLQQSVPLTQFLQMVHKSN